MRKNQPKIVIRADAPAIRTLPRYDRYFYQSLRRAIQADLERYPVGKPSYHKHLTELVEEHCKGVIDASVLDLKNFEHFLSGRVSQHPRMEVLDAFLQLIDPGRREACFPSAYLDRFGSVISDFFGVSPSPSEEDIEASIGVFEVQSEEKARTPSRYIVSRASANCRYCFVYDFRASLAPPIQSQKFRLKFGVFSGGSSESPLVMKELASCEPLVGSIGFHGGRYLTISGKSWYFDPEDENYSDEWNASANSVIDIRLFAERLDNSHTIKKLEEIVDSFHGMI